MRSLSTTFLYAAALAILAICLFPLVSVVAASLTGVSSSVWGLIETVLPGYALNTAGLVICTGIGALIIGVSTAWLVTMTRFPGRRILEIGLVLPFAFPAYVLAYAYTHLLDHPGIVQSTLRSTFDWGPRDYWFPEIRSFGGAAAMLILVLYPYVYLLARASFVSQSNAQFIAARTLGRGPWRTFLTVSLPMTRTAALGGALLVAMETIADFGTVAFFGVPTFATGIYQSWFSMGDRAAAAQLSLCLLSFAVLLAVLERVTRNTDILSHGKKREVMARFELKGPAAAGAIAVCGLPVVLGAVLPAGALLAMATRSEQNLLSARYLDFAQNSALLAGVGAALTVAAAIALAGARRARPSPVTRSALQAARLGYAVPGGVIAVGLMVPAAAFDNAFDAMMRETFGISTGLLITGSIALLVAAYMTRFLAAAIAAHEGGEASVSPNMDHAARVLGSSPLSAIVRVHAPLLAPSLLTATLIVFVDIMKELPATLILRPFNFDTLAVQAFRLASDERLTGAAVPSLVIAGIGLIPTILLCRRIGRE
ncbi:iron ABC transporter permease [Rhodobacteraceae bacterium CCMM004]|nr:iron ABC transporter permease [Rhodobacteraceae bacterium CCMM004]